MIIGITGRKRAGKDEAALVLMNQGYQLIKFADPLKATLRTLMASAGARSGDIDAAIDGENKEVPMPIFMGSSPRRVMQLLGTEFGRELIHEDFWVNIAMTRAALFENIVISDARFPNECEAIRAAGGTIIRITRPGFSLDRHISETGIDDLIVDFEIVNNGTLDDLRQNVLQIVSTL